MATYRDNLSGLEWINSYGNPPTAQQDFGFIAPNVAGPTAYQSGILDIQLAQEQQRQITEANLTNQQNKAISIYNKSLQNSLVLQNYMLQKQLGQVEDQASGKVNQIQAGAQAQRATYVTVAGQRGAMGNTLNRLMFASGFNQQQAEQVIRSNQGMQVAQNYLQQKANAVNSVLQTKQFIPALSEEAQSLRYRAIQMQNEASWLQNPIQTQQTQLVSNQTDLQNELSWLQNGEVNA